MIRNFWRLVFISVLAVSLLVVGLLVIKTTYRPEKLNLSESQIIKYKDFKPISQKTANLTPVVKKSSSTRSKADKGLVEVYSIKERALVRGYIREEAIKHGVEPDKALFIAEHESQFNPGAIGDSGISFGVWQFNLKANPYILKECALDYKCSTEIAMNWLVDGKENSWSVWRMRNLWYNEK